MHSEYLTGGETAWGVCVSSYFEFRKVRSAWILTRCLSICFIALLAPTFSRALDPSVRISQYGHFAWRSRDGYFSGTPRNFAQTRDGYIWIGTAAGLIRFNSIDFSPDIIPKERLPSREISSILGAHDGSLWIGTRSGLARYKDEATMVIPEFHDTVESILEDPAANIWISRESYGSPTGPICRVSHLTLSCLNASEGLVPDSCCAGPLARDHAGTLWLGTDRDLVSWRSGSTQTYPIKVKGSEGLDGIDDISVSKDGALWVGLAWTGNGGGLQRFEANKGFSPIITSDFDSSMLSVTRLLLDRDGSLWVGTADQGIYRLNGDHVDHFGTRKGLSGDFVTALFEDHEGNVWVATNGGIDCFHQLPVITFSKQEGLSGDNVVSVVSSADNGVWLANGSSLEFLKEGQISDIRSGKGLPGNEVTSLFDDHANRLWVGIDNDLFRYFRGRFRRVLRKDRSGTRFIVGITEDARHDVWAEVSGSKRELIRIHDLTVAEEYPETKVPSARPLAADPNGGIWLGLRDGNLARFRNGSVNIFPSPQNSNSEIRQVLVNADGSVFGTTAFGLVVWREGKSRTLSSHNGLPCDGVIGAAWENTETLWLYTECGLLRIPSTDLRRWEATPNKVIAPKVFGALDGVQPGIPDYNPMAKTTDGRLWFTNQYVLQSINPSHLVRNLLPPPVHIERIVANRKPLPPLSGLHLPPLMQDVEIDYAALSFVNPRAVRFRYTLAGHDSNWTDAGARRQEFFTDLGPGKYRFHVIACNNDGIWNESGASVDFFVDPAWYQTLGLEL